MQYKKRHEITVSKTTFNKYIPENFKKAEKKLTCVLYVLQVSKLKK